MRRAIEEAFQTRTEMQTEFRLKVTTTEAYRSFATIARPLFDAAGTPLGFVGVTQDVTARRESEAKLRRSEQLLRATTANTADTLMLVDTDLKVRFINRGDGGFAHRGDRRRARSPTILPEAARGFVVAKLRHVLITGETATYEFESHDEAGEPQYFENRAVLVHDDGIGTGLSISVTDITERKRLEQEILDVSSRERQIHRPRSARRSGPGADRRSRLMLRSLATRFQHQLRRGGRRHQRDRRPGESVDRDRALARARPVAGSAPKAADCPSRCASSRPAAAICTVWR